MIKTYFKRADAALLVYDISDKDSFEKIKNDYIEEIKENCKKDIPIILLGNKTDKENERQISKEDGMELAEQENYEFDECCCIKNLNVASAFETLLERWNFERHKEKQKEKHKEKRKEEEKEFTLRRTTITEKNFQKLLTEYSMEIEDDINNNKEINRHTTAVNTIDGKGRFTLTADRQMKKKKKCC